MKSKPISTQKSNVDKGALKHWKRLSTKAKLDWIGLIVC